MTASEHSALDLRDIPSIPGYRASADGRIFGKQKTGRPLSQETTRSGYKRVAINTGKRRLVHCLVLEAFKGPRPSPLHQSRHLNGIRSDNTIVNLEWGTKSENEEDKVRHGKTRFGTKNHKSKLNEEAVRRIREEYIPPSKGNSLELSKRYGVSQHQISEVVRGKYWKDS